MSWSTPSEPRTLANHEWPPDYVQTLAWRQQQLEKFRERPRLVVGAKEFYRTRPQTFINHWGITFDPRVLTGPDRIATLPFILFQRQDEFIEFLLLLVREQCNGLCEKSRALGVTWLCVLFSIWLWLFWDEATIGWGSRKAELVDKLGDPKSIFDKIRQALRLLPSVFMPKGFNEREDSGLMKLLNPETGATIVGEGGDSIGRGGRTLIYFLDEAAHVEHPVSVDSALSYNTNVLIEVSSVHGPATVFQRKRDAGKVWVPGAALKRDRTNVFVFDWSDHPAMDLEWYERERSKKESEGLAHVFAQEVDRNPSAAIVGTIIDARWVRAAIGAREALGIKRGGGRGAGLDVADEGEDRNALITRLGIEADSATEWGARDVGVTARHALLVVETMAPIEVQYDCISIGSAVKAEINRLEDLKLMPKGVRFIPWHAGESPLDAESRVNEDDDDSPINGDFFRNLKAQAWWQVARRFEKTFRARNEPSFTWTEEDIISLDPSMPLLQELIKELSQPVMIKSASTLKLVVDKKPDGAKSPNLGDAFIQAFWPVNVARPIMISAEVKRNVQRRSVMRKRLQAMGYA